MEKDIRVTLIAAALVFSLLVTFAQGKDDIAVSCYRVDASGDEVYMGTISVFKPEVATGNCNMIYNNCEGACIGCFANEDSVEVCIDKSGRQYYH